VQVWRWYPNQRGRWRRRRFPLLRAELLGNQDVAPDGEPVVLEMLWR
jgi:hypothetical protein